MVSLLLGRAATVHSRNWNCLTRLEGKAMAGRLRMVQEMLQARAEIQTRGNSGNTIAMNVIPEPGAGPGVVAAMLRAGASPRPGQAGRTIVVEVEWMVACRAAGLSRTAR